MVGLYRGSPCRILQRPQRTLVLLLSLAPFFTVVFGNVFTLLDRICATSRRDESAVIFNGTPRTYGYLRERALRFANALQAIGIAPGDRVAVLLPNCHEWPEIFFATAAMGAICVPVNVLNSGPEVLGVLEDCDANCLVLNAASDASLADASGLPEAIIAVGPSAVANTHDYESLLAIAATTVRDQTISSCSSTPQARQESPKALPTRTPGSFGTHTSRSWTSASLPKIDISRCRRCHGLLAFTT